MTEITCPACDGGGQDGIAYLGSWPCPRCDGMGTIKPDLRVRTIDRTSIVAEITAERNRQISEEGWTPEHDDTHDRGELANAAACYAYGEMIDTQTGCILWPWGDGGWKPSDRRRELIKAAALIIAEIERLDRAAYRIEENSRG